MTQVTNELMYELLKSMQQDIADIKQVQREQVGEFVSTRRHFAALDARLSAMQTDLHNIQDRQDRMDGRLSHVERRLDIVDEPVS